MRKIQFWLKENNLVLFFLLQERVPRPKSEVIVRSPSADMSTDILLGSAYDSGHRGSDRWMEANQSSARFFEKSKIKVLQGTVSLGLYV